MGGFRKQCLAEVSTDYALIEVGCIKCLLSFFVASFCWLVDED